MKHYPLFIQYFLAFALNIACSASIEAAELRGTYEAEHRTLTVESSSNRHFKFVFNKGGAIAQIYDLDLAPDTNLIGDSFQGETTDRVIQWTYWNMRYNGSEHTSGDKDRRANVTMEGCFHGKYTCDVLESPRSGKTNSLVFRSQIKHWFYSELDRHGTPDFETLSQYDVLEDGSLKLTRAVLRRPWNLRNVLVKSWDGKQWQETMASETIMVADHLWPRSMTSYFEGWTPLRRTTLPHQRHAKGKFDDDGYKFWKPQEVGGWAMAYGDQLALATVFGEQTDPNSPYQTTAVYNKLDLPGHNLNILLPGVETSWPDNASLSQTLIFVVGSPEDVQSRADRLVNLVPAPSIDVLKAN